MKNNTNTDGSSIHLEVVSMGTLNFKQKNDWLMGLMFDCPFGNSLDECPTKDARLLPVSGRMELVNGMEPLQVERIITHHKECICERQHRFLIGCAG